MLQTTLIIVAGLLLLIAAIHGINRWSENNWLSTSDRLIKFCIPIVFVFAGFFVSIGIIQVLKHRASFASEYLSFYYTKATYYEEWNEYITKICTREDCSGSGENRSCTTETYDCSYVDNHPEYWEAINNNGNEISISKSTYDQANKLWNTSKFVDMHRAYYTDDGDSYVSTMPDSAINPLSNKILGYTEEGSYSNKVIFSNSVFNFRTVDSLEVKKFGLYPLSNYYIAGTSNTEAERILRNANYIYGLRDQLFLRVLVFNNKPELAGEMQESYWKGGNKNEFTVCIGVEKQNITWVKVISWTTKEILKVDVRDDIYNMKLFDAVAISKYLASTVPRQFVRREFAEFNYLPDPEKWYMYLIGVLIIIAFTAGGFILKYRLCE